MHTHLKRVGYFHGMLGIFGGVFGRIVIEIIVRTAGTTGIALAVIGYAFQW